MVVFIFVVVVFFQNNNYGFASNKADKIGSLIRLSAEDGYLNGAVLIAEKGKIIYQKAFGLANLEWGIPSQLECKFEIYSIAKQFTSMLIMQLVEEGKIRLEGRITDYLPFYRKDTGDRITIHHLLTHSHGIPQPDWEKIPPNHCYAIDEFVKTFLSGDLDFEPGNEFSYGYSGRGYIICAAIIEKVTGKDYEKVLKEKILDPLNMKHTGLYNSRVLLKSRADTYRNNRNTYYKRISRDPSQNKGASCMYSTIGDLYLWDQALYRNKLLSNKYKELMFRPHIPASGQYYGYGWRVTELSIGNTKKKIVWHSGGGISIIYRSIEDGHLVILLNNMSLMDKRIEICHHIMDILYDQPYILPKKSIASLLLKVISDKGIESAILFYHDLKTNHPQKYNFREIELNMLGYELLHQNEIKSAIKIFKLNANVYSQSWNVYDSLGEAYLRNNQKKIAIKYYKKSLELSHNNKNAKDILEKLKKKERVNKK